MYRQPALEILHRASELVSKGDYSTSGIAALLAIYSPLAHQHYFAGPLLSFTPHRCSSLSFLPEWLIQLVHLRRLDLIITETQNEWIGDLAVLADVMAFFYLLHKSGDLPKEWRPLYRWAAREAMKPGSAVSQWEEGDGAKLRKNIRREIARLSVRADIASLLWHDQPIGLLSTFPSRGDISLRQLGFIHLKSEPGVEIWRQ